MRFKIMPIFALLATISSFAAGESRSTAQSINLGNSKPVSNGGKSQLTDLVKKNSLLSVEVDSSPKQGVIVTLNFLSEPVFLSSILKNPARLVLDLANVRLDKNFPKLKEVTSLFDIRFGSHADKTRAVIDFPGEEIPTHDVIPDGNSLVLSFSQLKYKDKNGNLAPLSMLIKPKAQVNIPAKTKRKKDPIKEWKVDQIFWPATETITVKVKDAFLKDVLSLFREASGHPIVFNEWLYETVSLDLTAVPWKDALETLLQLHGYRLIRIGKVFHVVSQKDMALDNSHVMCYR